MKDPDCKHERLIQDAFAKLVGVSRSVPGDVVCGQCFEPLPLRWNGGHPVAAERIERRADCVEGT